MTVPAGPPPKVKSPPQLPVFIGIVSAFAMFGGIIALALIPIALLSSDWGTELDGVVVHGWKAVLVNIVIFGLFIGGGVAGLALVMQWRWGRPVVVAGWIVLKGASIVVADSAMDWAAAVEVAVFTAFAWWYFYRKRNVVDFFEALAQVERRKLSSDQAPDSLGESFTGSEIAR